MTSDELQSVIAYVTPYYDTKDPLHGLPHAWRILDAARAIARSEGVIGLDDILTYGALFHGLAAQSVDDIEGHFPHDAQRDLSKDVVAAAVASLGKTPCSTVADKVLHDAHMIEGGALLYYFKPLLTGTYMHQSMEETLTFIDQMLSDVPACYFEYARRHMASYADEAKAIHNRFRSEILPSTPSTL